MFYNNPFLFYEAIKNDKKSKNDGLKHDVHKKMDRLGKI